MTELYRDILERLTPDSVNAIASELCDGVRGAKPGHPQLRTDIGRALYLALASPLFRTAVHELCARGQGIRENDPPAHARALRAHGIPYRPLGAWSEADEVCAYLDEHELPLAMRSTAGRVVR